MAYAACGHGQNSAKSTWSRWLTPPVDMDKTVQKAPGVDSKRRLWPCDRSGGARWLRPPPSHLPPSPHLPGGLEHVRHLGPGRWLQVASAPLSHLHAPPRHTWRAGARAPPGRHFGNFIVRVLLNRNVLYTASAPRAAPAAPPQSTLATLGQVAWRGPKPLAPPERSHGHRRRLESTPGAFCTALPMATGGASRLLQVLFALFCPCPQAA